MPTKIKKQNLVTPEVNNELFDTNVYFNAIMDFSPDGIVIHDRNKVVFANKSAVNILEANKLGQLIGRPIISLVAPEYRKIVKNRVASQKKGKISSHIEEQFITLKNNVIDVDVTAVPIDFQKKNHTLVVFRDITKQKAVQKALKVSEEKYLSLIESSPNCIKVLDKHYKIIQINNQGVVEHGFQSQKDAVGYDYFKTIDECCEKKVKKALNKAFSGKTVTVDVQHKLVSGKDEPYWGTSIYSPLYNGGKKVTSVMAVSINITEKKKSSDMLSLIASNVNDVIWVMDLNLRFTYVSESVKRQRGYTVKEVMDQKLKESVSINSYKTILNVFKEELDIEKKGKSKKNRARTIRIESIRKNGTTIPLEVRTSFLRDSLGKPLGVVGVSRDISEQVKVEKDLLSSHEKYKSVIDSSNLLIFTLNNKHEIIDYYTPDKGVLYVKPKVFLKKHFSDVFSEEIGLKFDEAFVYVEENQLSTQFDYQLKIKNKLHWLNASLNPSINAKGKTTNVIVVISNITKRKNFEQENIILENKYRSFFDSSPNCIKVLDAKGAVMDMNVVGMKEHGFKSVKNALNWDYISSVHEDYKKSVQSGIKKALKGVVSSIELKHSKDVSCVREACHSEWFILTLAPLVSSSGEQHVLAVSRDVSAIKESESRITATLLEQKKLNKLMVGRELKMIELKKELVSLQEELLILKAKHDSV